jgi:hypothetical protein
VGCTHTLDKPSGSLIILAIVAKSTTLLPFFAFLLPFFPNRRYNPTPLFHHFAKKGARHEHHYFNPLNHSLQPGRVKALFLCLLPA